MTIITAQATVMIMNDWAAVIGNKKKWMNFNRICHYAYDCIEFLKVIN